ncbi:MAG: peptidylprolyl isomerase [Pseudomonadaceae bacterium]|nr:peptidylprolyl isomerase [Pseudomonadaceae bacterium]
MANSDNNERSEVSLGRRLLDPLIIFIVLGGLLFWLTWAVEERSDSIVISTGTIERIQAQWQAQMGKPPTAEELDNLLEDSIREEIYYREAKRLGLDAGDTIIRRRLVQKLTFVTEDIADNGAVTEDDLRAFYDANPERYTLPARWSFRHRYFSSDRREDAQSDAQAAVASDAIEGDAFMLQSAYAQRSMSDVANLFGRQFASAFPELPVGEWTGPVRSAYGYHAVLVESALPSRQLALNEVRERVAADLKSERRSQANQDYYERLRARYEVVREAPQA